MKTKTPESKPPAGPELMTQIQYAKHRGVSRQYIGKLVKAGALLMGGDKINVSGSDAVLDDKDPVGVNIGPDGEPKTLTEARYLKELYSARLRRLEYEERAGLMIPAGAVTAAWTTAAGSIKTRMLGIPTKVAPQIAALTDVKAVRGLLSDAIEKALKVLAEELRYGIH